MKLFLITAITFISVWAQAQLSVNPTSPLVMNSNYIVSLPDGNEKTYYGPWTQFELLIGNPTQQTLHIDSVTFTVEDASATTLVLQQDFVNISMSAGGTMGLQQILDKLPAQNSTQYHIEATVTGYYEVGVPITASIIIITQ